MSFPTSVNGQITDSLATGSVSSHHIPLAEQILQISTAFTKSLEMENEVYLKQLNGVVQMTLDTLKQFAAITKEARPNLNARYKEINDLQTRASADLASIVPETPKAPAIETVSPNGSVPNLEGGVVQAVVMSYHNAVTSQQNANVTIQAAVTILISTMIDNAKHAFPVSGLNANG